MKYNSKQIKEMAITLWNARDNNDDRFFDFVFTVSEKTNKSPGEVINYIREMGPNNND